MSKENINELWNTAKELLKNETTAITFLTWIQPLEIKSFRDNTVVLVATNKFQRDTLEKKYIDLLTNTFNVITHKKCQVFIQLENQEDDVILSTSKSIGNNKVFIDSGLNPKYTFSTFVIGNNNKFAQAAAMGVAESPGGKYNPLFIYGGVGLGKTHLMQSIGNQILSNNLSSKVLYVTSETFTNQLINALRDQATDKFRNKYRNIDVLLIDDIQFIANKKSTQEEFFHTFNTLYEAGKQIVISSDKPPKDIELLEDRLKSRFEWGLIADISNPDYETRLAILRKKTQLDNIIIDDDILSAIATKLDTNIRELEGTLNKLIAKASLTNSPITMEMTQKAIDDIVAQQQKVISSEYIQEVVGKYFDIDPADLKGSKRSNDVTFPRQIAMYLCRNVAQMSMPQIGKDFGGRDHSTVNHSCNKIEKEMKTNSNTRLIVESVQNLLTKNN
ncbi:MAG: chromosomal replication initiator protein DnaA [Clostridia bacterium]|nr:chromosomal replication initiator protein DnaA [Clostridia bacterium]